MITPEGDYVVCDDPGCKEQIKNHSWGKTKASDWFFLHSGQSYCGAHHPDWVAQWRKNKNRKEK